MRIYVGNLDNNVTEDKLRQAFEAFGQVGSVSIMTDRMTGRPKGFAFVEMPTQSEAEAAIAGLNGKPLEDRMLVVNEARPRPAGGMGGGGFDRRGGGGGGGGRSFGGGRSGGGGGGGGGGGRRRY